MKMLTLTLTVSSALLLASANRVMQVPKERRNALMALAEVTTERAVSARAPLAAAGPPASADKVKDLQKERIATLKALAEVTTKLAVNGRAPLEEALEARLLLLEAEADAAEKEADRITLYTGCVDTLKEYEKLADARKQAALGTEATVLKIKARRLEVEIRLEQARSRENKDHK